MSIARPTGATTAQGEGSDAEYASVGKRVEEQVTVQQAFRRVEEIVTIGPRVTKLTKAAINRTDEIMGSRDALLANLDPDTQIELAEASGPAEFTLSGSEQGLVAARQ